MTFVGYDPVGLGLLERAARAAADALADLHSPDPEAGDAVAALRRFRRFLADDLVPAVTEIRRRDPLAPLRREWVATAIHLGSAAPPSGRHDVLRRLGVLDTLDVLDVLRRLEVGVDDDGRPSFSSPAFRTVAALAPGLADRARRDPAVGDALVDLSAAGSPWPGIATGFAAFDADLVDRLAATLLRRTSWVDDAVTRHRALATEVVLVQIVDDDRRCLRLLADTEVAAELATWPLVDRDLADAIADRALTAAARDPDLLHDVQNVVTGYVSLANADRFERGFPAPLAGSLATGLVGLLPGFVGRIHDPVDWAGHDGFATGAALGGYEEFVDFLGALLRDPVAADTLLAGVADATRLTLRDGAWFTLDDVGDLALALERAARNERVEEELAAAARRTAVERLTTGLATAAATVGVATAAGPAARLAVGAVVEGGGSLLARTTSTGDAGTPAAGEMAAVLVTHTLLHEVLADPARLGADLDPDLLAAAHDGVARADRLLADGGADLAPVRRALDDAAAAIARLGRADLLADLDTGSLGRLADRDPIAD